MKDLLKKIANGKNTTICAQTGVKLFNGASLETAK